MESIVLEKFENVSELNDYFKKFGSNWKKKAEEQMTDFAKKFLKDNYDLELVVPITINNRLKSTFGYFKYMGKTPLNISMSAQYMKIAIIDGEDGLANIMSTLKHELIHYALFMKGLPHNDGDAEFENELLNHGAHSSGSTNMKKALATNGRYFYSLRDVLRYSKDKYLFVKHNSYPGISEIQVVKYYY